MQAFEKALEKKIQKRPEPLNHTSFKEKEAGVIPRMRYEGEYSTRSGFKTRYMCLLIQQVTDFIRNHLNMCAVSVGAAELLLKVCRHVQKVTLNKFIAELHALYSTDYLTCQVNFHDRESGQFKSVGSKLKSSLILVI